MNKYNLSEFSQVLVDKNGLSKEEAEKFIRQMFEIANDALAEERLLKIRGLGSFKLTKVKDRESINVNTGERIVIESRDKINFTPETTLKDIVNKPFSQFETVFVNDGTDVSALEKIEYDASLSGKTEEPSNDNDAPEVTEVATEEANAAEETVTEEVEETAAENVTESVDENDSPVEESVDTTEDENVVTEEDGAPEEESTDDSEGIKISFAAADVDGNENIDSEDDNNVSEENETDEEDTDSEEKEVTDSDEETADSDEEETESQENEEQSSDAAVEENDDNDSDSSENEEETHQQDEEVDEETSSDEDSNVEEETEDTSETTDEDDDEEVTYYEDEEVTLGKKTYYIGIACLGLLLVGVVALFYLYNKESSKNDELKAIISTMNNKTASTSTADNKKKEDSLNLIRQQKALEVAEKAKQEEEKAEDKEVEESESSDNSSASDSEKDYNKDPRIRTGAYRIVGVEKVVTAKSGQDVSDIARMYLGKGMECYIEALNGRDISAGQKVKIPELKLKKKK